MNVMVGCSF